MIVDPLILRIIKASLVENKIIEGKALCQDYPEASKVYLFIEDFELTWKKLPDVFHVEEHFGMRFQSLEEPFELVKDAFVKREKLAEVKQYLKDQVASFNGNNLEQIFENCSRLLDKKFDYVPASVFLYKETAPERYEHYLDLKTKKVEDVIPTPWSVLNSDIRGFVNGTLNVFVGNSSVGKTWLLCVLANHVSNLKKKVLFVSAEMAQNRLAVRLDVVKFKIKFKELRDGALTVYDEKEYLRCLEEYKLSDLGEVALLGKQEVKTPKDVFDYCKSFNPDIVLIDSAYRLKSSDSGKAIWENQFNLVKELQELAEKSNVPWVVTSQLWDDDEGAKGSTFKRRDKVKYGKEWIIDPDVVLSLRQNDDLRLVKKMEIQALKLRDSHRELSSFFINWNVETLDYSEILPDSDSTPIDPTILGDIKPIEF